MFFNITHFCTFFQVKCMNTVMSAIFSSTVVNTTSGYDRYICVFSNKEVIVYHVF